MNDYVRIIFGLFGGLAIFIFGMNMMSEYLQKIAGERMKNVIYLLTKNPILGILSGALTTAVLQSSSATTVMAIGFVSARVMNLRQAISIILGANIGTTMTAQIIAFKLSNYIYLFIALGFIIAFLSKKEKRQNIGYSIFAFGLLFEGIEIMGGVMKPLAQSPIFIEMIKGVSDTPILGVVVGTIMTVIVQSSSATIAVLQNFAMTPSIDGTSSVIGLQGAIPILLGDNIGTTITALLAAIGQQSKDAKRAAITHSVFNISGMLVFIWIIEYYASFIQFISPKGEEIAVISRQIANAHSVFNIFMTICWLPFIPLLLKIVTLIIRDNPNKQTINLNDTKYLDINLINQPIAALKLVTKEVFHLQQVVYQMLEKLLILSESKQRSQLNKIVEDSILSKNIYISIGDYINSMYASGHATHEQAERFTKILYLVNDIYRVGSICAEISEIIVNKSFDEYNRFSEEAIKDISNSLREIQDMFIFSTNTIINKDDIKIDELNCKRECIITIDATLRRGHIERVQQNICSTDRTSTFDSILHNIERMGYCCVNIVDVSASNNFNEIVLNDYAQ